jgi:hypothetical protein
MSEGRGERVNEDVVAMIDEEDGVSPAECKGGGDGVSKQFPVVRTGIEVGSGLEGDNAIDVGHNDRCKKGSATSGVLCS